MVDYLSFISLNALRVDSLSVDCGIIGQCLYLIVEAPNCDDTLSQWQHQLEAIVFALQPKNKLHESSPDLSSKLCDRGISGDGGGGDDDGGGRYSENISPSKSEKLQQHYGDLDVDTTLYAATSGDNQFVDVDVAISTVVVVAAANNIEASNQLKQQIEPSPHVPTSPISVANNRMPPSVSPSTTNISGSLNNSSSNTCEYIVCSWALLKKVNCFVLFFIIYYLTLLFSCIRVFERRIGTCDGSC